MKNRCIFVPIFCLSCFVVKADEEKLERPNILIILADDAGYGDFGFMGCKDTRTPNIDKLAGDGRFFTDAHVAATVSSPSRAMLMTGRYGQRFGYECNTGRGEGLPADEQILAALLKRYGYRTACIGKWHLGDLDFQHPNSKGFDEFYGLIGGSRSYYYDPAKSDRANNWSRYEHNGAGLAFEGYFTDELTRRAVDYIEADDAAPFMMYLSYTAPHSPNQALDSDRAHFKGEPRDVYSAMLYALDRGVGELVESLKRSDKYDNTLIFFLSDNGGATTNNSSNTPLKGFKGNKFEGGHRTPFVVTLGTRFKDSEPFEGLTSSLDIFATVVDAVGIDTEDLHKSLDGVSLLPYIYGDKSGEPHKELYWRKMDSRAHRYGDYKVITTQGVDTVLYDLSTDLDEMKDLSDMEPAKLKQMLKRLDSWEERYCIDPLWIEDGWAPVTNDFHRRLMRNEIKTQSDLKRK